MQVDVNVESGMTEKQQIASMLNAVVESLRQTLLDNVEAGDEVSLEESEEDGAKIYKFKVVPKEDDDGC